MNLKPFLTYLAIVLEADVGDLNESYELVWDSILVVSAITLLSRHFDLTLDVDDLLKCTTIGSLCQSASALRRAA